MPRASCSTAARSSGVSSSSREAWRASSARRISSPRARSARDDRRERVASAGGSRSDGPPRPRSRGRARSRRPSRSSCSDSRSRSETMSISVTPGERPHRRLHVARHREVHEHERAAARVRRARPTLRLITHARGAGRAHDEVRPGERLGQARRGRRARRSMRSASDARVFERTVQDPDRARRRGGAGASRRAPPSAPRPPRRRRGPPGRRAHSAARSAPSATNASGAAPSPVSARTRRPAREAAWNSAFRRGPCRVLPLGPAQRLPHLRVDLRLAQHHRVESGGDGEEVVGRVLLVVGVQGLGQGLGVDAVALGQQPLQREEPAVVARDVGRDLDPVARGQDHGLARPRPGPARGGRPSAGRRR